MCLACQMEDELWFAYLEQVAQQEKKAAADPAAAPERAKPAGQSTAAPFICEEQPSE